ncbi:MAG: MBOAT family protein, partial [Muribaculaceae bacterium]|nr:MBOAT family protein [Muribaculaceae bacterium]
MNQILHNIASMLGYDPASPMLFTSGLFWALFLVFIPIYALLKRSRMKMMIFVILFSLYFYSKSSGIFFMLLVATSAVDYLISKMIARTEKKATRLTLLVISVVISTGVLAYFKYANFLLSTWTDIIGGNFQPLDIILPIGIS